MSTLMKEIDHDAETARLAQYVAGTMSEAEVERFKTELVADEEFFDRMAPLLAVFFPRQPLPAQQATIDAMRVEAAEIREARIQRARIREHITIALGSLLSLKPMLGVGAVATAALVAAVTIKHRQGVDSVPTRIFVAHDTTTHVATVTTVTPRTSRPGTVAVTPERVPRLELDPEVERAVDSMVAPRILPQATGSAVTLARPTAPPRPPQKQYAWYVPPSDTIPVPKLDKPTLLGRVGNALGAVGRWILHK